MPASPYSSNGPVSTNGTPDTRITAFTPDGISARAIHDKSSQSQGRPLFGTTGICSVTRSSQANSPSADPFYSGSNGTNAPKITSVLRATTPAFKPSGNGRPAIVDGSYDQTTVTALQVLEDTLQNATATWIPPPTHESMSAAQSRVFSSASDYSRVLRVTTPDETISEAVIRSCEAVSSWIDMQTLHTG